MSSAQRMAFESPIMTLTREVISRLVHNRVGLSKAVETTFEIIKQNFEGGEDVLISGFGKFCLKDKGKRRSRTPGTGEDLKLAKRRIVTFKCPSVLRGNLNSGGKKAGGRARTKPSSETRNQSGFRLSRSSILICRFSIDVQAIKELFDMRITE